MMTRSPSNTTWTPSSRTMPTYRELFDWLAHDSSRPAHLPSLSESICAQAARCMAEQIGLTDGHPICILEGGALTVKLSEEIRRIEPRHLSRSVWSLARRNPLLSIEYLIGRIAYSWSNEEASFDDLTEEELLVWLNAALYVLRADEEFAL